MLTLQQKQLSDQPIKRLPTAISTNTNPKAHLDVAAKQYADSGYSHIELQVEHGAINDIENPRVICGLTDLRQLYPKLKFSGHASYKKTDLAASDEIVRQKSVARVKKEIDFFKEFDVKLLTVHTGRGNSGTNFDKLCRSVEGLVAYSDTLDMEICVETAGRDGFLLLTADEYAKLAQRTGCKLTLDLPHLMTTNPNNFWEDLDQLISLAGNGHLSDTFIPHHLHNPIGFGNFVNEHLIRFLFKRGYEGQIVIDAAEKGYSPEMYQNQGIAFCDRLSQYLTLG